LYGSDLQAEFLDIGYSLFKDATTLKSTFIAADIFDNAVLSPLHQLEGKLDIIWAGSFLHLFTWDSNVLAIKRMITLLKPVKGSMVIGKQMGNVKTGEFVHQGALQGSMYLHDGESFKRMWVQVGEETETRWDVVVESESIAGPQGSLGLRFACRRL
jgi:hypothetical protein